VRCRHDECSHQSRAGNSIAVTRRLVRPVHRCQYARARSEY
jgi:hypothetical protein